LQSLLPNRSVLVTALLWIALDIAHSILRAVGLTAKLKSDTGVANQIVYVPVCSLRAFEVPCNSSLQGIHCGADVHVESWDELETSQSSNRYRGFPGYL
jgi:hypothetical protein